jgi:sugar/nucleoside kinase (ribokinase family)
MQHLINSGKKLVICTHGNAGSTALTQEGTWLDTPIISAYAKVDTNGAGDAFFSGFLYGHSHSYPVVMCLRLATIAAGVCITSSELALQSLTPALLESEYAKHYGEPLQR